MSRTKRGSTLNLWSKEIGKVAQYDQKFNELSHFKPELDREEEDKIWHIVMDLDLILIAKLCLSSSPVVSWLEKPSKFKNLPKSCIYK